MVKMKNMVDEILLCFSRNNKVNHKTGKMPPPEKEQRRKKLSKRSRTIGHIKLKAVQYSPTEEDISQLLKEFTVDFLLNGEF